MPVQSRGVVAKNSVRGDKKSSAKWRSCIGHARSHSLLEGITLHNSCCLAVRVFDRTFLIADRKSSRQSDLLE